ncbi:hypothetical protein ACQR0Z_01780 [Bradyrhizobium sp. HKCCYLS3077]|uniref:hypothetical protein n=1 Tax=Bradyrhizobium sp. HKCCYLS3077 TaxID=3420761 RepID=UPI003EC0C416
MPGAGRTHGPPATKKQAAVTTGSAEITRHSPRDGFHAYVAISPVSGLLATVTLRLIMTTELDASIGAPGPRVFTSASLPFVGERKARCSKLAATASPPACRDDRDAPLSSGRDGVTIGDILKNGRRIFLHGGLDRGDAIERADEIRFSAHTSNGVHRSVDRRAGCRVALSKALRWS